MPTPLIKRMLKAKLPQYSVKKRKLEAESGLGGLKRQTVFAEIYLPVPIQQPLPYEMQRMSFEDVTPLPTNAESLDHEQMFRNQLDTRFCCNATRSDVLGEHPDIFQDQPSILDIRKWSGEEEDPPSLLSCLPLFPVQPHRKAFATEQTHSQPEDKIEDDMQNHHHDVGTGDDATETETEEDENDEEDVCDENIRRRHPPHGLGKSAPGQTLQEYYDNVLPTKPARQEDISTNFETEDETPENIDYDGDSECDKDSGDDDSSSDFDSSSSSSDSEDD